MIPAARCPSEFRRAAARENSRKMEKMAEPKIVSAEEWQRERDELLTAEMKAAADR